MRRWGRRGVALVGVTLAGFAAPAVAQVIGDPLGLAEIATAGEPAHGFLLGVSNGGGADGIVAVSNGGDVGPTSYVGVAVGGRVDAIVAVSVGGDTSGACCGPGGGEVGVLGVTTSGTADGAAVNVTGDGNASG